MKKGKGLYFLFLLLLIPFISVRASGVTTKSLYTIGYEGPTTFALNTPTVVPVSLKATTNGGIGYDQAILKVQLLQGNKDNIDVIATDDLGNEWDVIDVGSWGRAKGAGFSMSPEYDGKMNVKINLKSAGTYQVKIDLVDMNNHDQVISTTTVTLTGENISSTAYIVDNQKKNSTYVIFPIILGVAIMGGLGYFFYRKKGFRFSI